MLSDDRMDPPIQTKYLRKKNTFTKAKKQKIKTQKNKKQNQKTKTKSKNKNKIKKQNKQTGKVRKTVGFLNYIKEIVDTSFNGL